MGTETFIVVTVNTETGERDSVVTLVEKNAGSSFGYALMAVREQLPEGWVVDRNETICPEGSQFRVEFRVGTNLRSSRVVAAHPDYTDGLD